MLWQLSVGNLHLRWALLLQETQLAALRKKIQDTEAQRDKANDELENLIDDLDLQATL